MRWRDEDGWLTGWMLGLAVAVLFLGGLSLDLWRAFTERRDLAGIVDAAAITGASAIDEDAYRREQRVVLDPAAATVTACHYLTTNRTPCDGILATPERIAVTARREVPLTLLRVLAPQQQALRIEVSAVVEPRIGVP